MNKQITAILLPNPFFLPRADSKESKPAELMYLGFPSIIISMNACPLGTLPLKSFNQVEIESMSILSTIIKGYQYLRTSWWKIISGLFYKQYHI